MEWIGGAGMCDMSYLLPLRSTNMGSSGLVQANQQIDLLLWLGKCSKEILVPWRPLDCRFPPQDAMQAMLHWQQRLLLGLGCYF